MNKYLTPRVPWWESIDKTNPKIIKSLHAQKIEALSRIPGLNESLGHSFIQRDREDPANRIENVFVDCICTQCGAKIRFLSSEAIHAASYHGPNLISKALDPLIGSWFNLSYSKNESDRLIIPSCSEVLMNQALS